MKGKRISTALAAVIAIAALLLAAGARTGAKAGGQTAPQLEGSWEVTVTNTNGSQFKSLATFSRGGGVIVADTDPNSSEGHGAWAKLGGQQYGATFVFLLHNSQRQLVGTVKVRAVIDYDPQTDTFSGQQQAVVTIGGNVVADSCGTVQGTRIAVEPPACP